MIIILEGPDGGGKTTLSEKLRQMLNHERLTNVVKHGPYTGMSSEELCKTYFRSMSQALTYDDHVILDRSWLSEPIYGEVYRNGVTRVDMPRHRMLERVALTRGAVVIHCQPEFALCVDTFKTRKDIEYLDTTEQLGKVYDAYETLPMHTCLPIVHYDYEKDTVSDLLEKVMAKSVPNRASGGGCFKEGNILMLCDKGPRTNMRASAAVVPFINFLDDDGPSRMLAHALENEGVPEKDLYWINTQNYLGTPTDAKFINQLKPSRIFALGNNAYSWAINAGVQVYKLPPPLYHMQHFPHLPYHITESDYGNTTHSS
jgi:thymidylate kinase